MTYDEIREVIPSISMACLYHAHGKLDKLLQLGLDTATDDFCGMYYELLDISADFICENYNEYYNTNKWYFSFYSMMEYYRLCRTYSNKFGILLRENPHMITAEQAVDRIMGLGTSYGYGYRLQTKINHQWASGIVLETDEYFDGHEALLEALLELDEWFRQGVEMLKDDLQSKSTEARKEAA